MSVPVPVDEDSWISRRSSVLLIQVPYRVDKLILHMIGVSVRRPCPMEYVHSVSVKVELYTFWFKTCMGGVGV